MSGKVWAVWHLDYEGGNIESVHATREGAEAWIQDDWERFEREYLSDKSPEEKKAIHENVEINTEIREYEVEDP